MTEQSGLVTWSAIFVALSGSWQYGFSIGSINAAYLPVKTAIQQYYEMRWNTNVSSELVEAVWVASSAAFPTGGIFGCLLVGLMAQRHGLMNALTIGHFVTVLVSIFMSLSFAFHSPEMLLIGRFGIGITSSLVSTGLTVMYSAEVSPQHLRGTFGSMVSVGIAISIFMANVLGLPQILGGPELWPVLLGLTGAPSVLFLILRKTLLDKSKKEVQASHEDVQLGEELVSLSRPVSPIPKSMTFKKVLCTKSLRWPLIIAVTLCAAHQLTGLNGVSFNMSLIFFRAGITTEHVPYVTIAVCCGIVLVNLICARLTDRYGRKFLLSLGYAIEGISLLLLAVSMETQQLSKSMAYVSVVASLGFWIGFSAGPGPVTFVIIAELFESSSRSTGVTIATVVLWFNFVVVVIATPYMLAAIGGSTFIPFGVFAFLALAFVCLRVPETKNMSFSEIQRSFSMR